jgi:hypothetical protein
MADLSPEALALIEEGKPLRRTQPMPVNVSHVEPNERPNSEPDTSADSTRELAVNKVSKHKETREKPVGEAIVGRGSVSLSIRVPSEIPDALVRASADRKIKRLRPFTQQDIAVEALTLWLRKNGYVS